MFAAEALASSTLTREMAADACGLIDDLGKGHYFDTPGKVTPARLCSWLLTGESLPGRVVRCHRAIAAMPSGLAGVLSGHHLQHGIRVTRSRVMGRHRGSVLNEVP